MMEKSESKEVLIDSSPDVDATPKIARTNSSFHQFLIECASNENRSLKIFNSKNLNWTNSWTQSILKIQLTGICILVLILVTIYGSNLPVKTALSSDLIPLWSLWVIAMYTLSLCIGYSFHFYPSCFGILISAMLQLLTFAFSSYFELITLTVLEQNGRLDKNDITRCWGAFLYSSIFVANGVIICSSLILIFTSFRDVCGKTKLRQPHNVTMA